MPDWCTQNFSLKGKTGRERRSVALNHLAFLFLVDLLLVLGIDLILGEPPMIALAVALVFSLMDLALTAAEIL